MKNFRITWYPVYGIVAAIGFCFSLGTNVCSDAYTETKVWFYAAMAVIAFLGIRITRALQDAADATITDPTQTGEDM